MNPVGSSEKDRIANTIQVDDILNRAPSDPLLMIYSLAPALGWGKQVRMTPWRTMFGLSIFLALGAAPAWADAVYKSKADCDNMFNSKGTQFKPDAAQQGQLSDCRACVDYQGKWNVAQSGAKCLDAQGRTIMWKAAQCQPLLPAMASLNCGLCLKKNQLGKVSGGNVSCESPPPKPK